jgi:16S rRNA (uracil1498-N3)-methyltransferase
MTRRYYVPQLAPRGGLTELPQEEAQHALRVMRIQVGDAITLFDGRGHESAAIVVQTGRQECHCDAQPPEWVSREPERAIHLGVALPKPERAREMIERLTEIGVQRLTPLIAERTQRPPSPSLIDKLQRGVIEACKQCGRNVLLQIDPPQPVIDFFAAHHDATRIIAQPAADALTLDAIHRGSRVVAAIGPEGGWSDEELRSARQHGFTAVDLGQRTYRIETAAVVLAALLVS